LHARVRSLRHPVRETRAKQQGLAVSDLQALQLGLQAGVGLVPEQNVHADPMQAWKGMAQRLFAPK